MRTPRAVLPLNAEYIVIGQLLAYFKNLIYEMTEEQFTKIAMTKSRGAMNPVRVGQIYRELMEEAGLQPLYEEKSDG